MISIYIYYFLVVLTTNIKITVASTRSESIPTYSIIDPTTPKANNRQLFGYDFSVDDSNIELQMDTSNVEYWDLAMRYGFSGTQFDSSIMKIYDYTTCETEILAPPITLLDPAITYDEPGYLDVHVGIDVVGTQQNSILWQNYEGDGELENFAEISFCVQVDLFFESTLVNTIGTKIKIEAHGSGAFGEGSVETDLEASSLASTQVDFEFPITIYPCDLNSLPVQTYPIITPGTVIRFCVELANPDEQLAYVDVINNVKYFSVDPSIQAREPIKDGVATSNLSYMDCFSVEGGMYNVCRY